MARPDEERPDDWVDAHRRALEEVSGARMTEFENDQPPAPEGPAWLRGMPDFGRLLQSVMTGVDVGTRRSPLRPVVDKVGETFEGGQMAGKAIAESPVQDERLREIEEQLAQANGLSRDDWRVRAAALNIHRDERPDRWSIPLDPLVRAIPGAGPLAAAALPKGAGIGEKGLVETIVDPTNIIGEAAAVKPVRAALRAGREVTAFKPPVAAVKAQAEIARAAEKSDAVAGGLARTAERYRGLDPETTAAAADVAPATSNAVRVGRTAVGATDRGGPSPEVMAQQNAIRSRLATLAEPEVPAGMTRLYRGQRSTATPGEWWQVERRGAEAWASRHAAADPAILYVDLPTDEARRYFGDEHGSIVNLPPGIAQRAVPLDSEQLAARTGTVSPKQRAVADDLAEQVARREIAQSLSQKTVQNGGFTYSPTKGVEPTVGFAVSPYKQFERQVPLDDNLPQAIEQYMIEHAEHLAQPGHHLGSWVDNGSVYLDVSIVAESPADAQRLALAHKQQAYYDLAKGETVPVAAPEPKPLGLSESEEMLEWKRGATIGDMLDDEPTTTPRAAITKERPMPKRPIVVDDFDKRAIRERIKSATPAEIALASKWYDDAEDIVIEWSDLGHGSFPRDNVAVAMAALSPQQAWVDPVSEMDNLKSFAKLVEAAEKGAIEPPYNVNMSAGQVRKAWAALHAEDPWQFVRGPKEVDFALNLAGRGDHAVIDRHIRSAAPSVAAKRPTNALTLTEYRRIQKAYAEVATELVQAGVLPIANAQRTLQALDWGLISKNNLEFRANTWGGGYFHVNDPSKLPYKISGILEEPDFGRARARARSSDALGAGLTGENPRARGLRPRDVSPGVARNDAINRVQQMSAGSGTPEATRYRSAKAVPGFKRTAAEKIAVDRAEAAGQGGGEAYLGSQDEYFSPQTQQVMRDVKTRLEPTLAQTTGPVTYEQTLLAANLSGRTPEAAIATLNKRGEGAQAIVEAAMGVEHYVTVADNIAAKLAGGGANVTIAERVDALFALRQAAATIADFNEASSELGRALNARKIAMRRELALNPSDQAWREALKKIGGSKMTPDKVDELLQRLLLVRGNPRATYALLRDLNHGSLEDMLFEYSQAAILSAVPTHMVNTYSGTVQHSLMLARVVGETGLQVGLSPLFKNAAGAEDIAAFGAGYLDGLKNISAATLNLMRRRMDFYEYSQGMYAAKHGGESIRHGGAIPGRLGEFVRIPFKGLTIEDFFQTMPAFNGRLRQLASQAAGKEGLKGMDRLARAAEIAAHAPDSMLREAHLFAERYALHSRGETLHSADDLLNRLHLRWIVRFTTTPTNIVKMGLEHSPVGLVRLRSAMSGRDRAAIAAEAAIGTAIIATFAGMMESGQMTGLRPTNKTERDMMEAEGVGPMMMRSAEVPLVGGLQQLFNANNDANKRWVSTYVLGPLIVPYLIAAAVREVESQRLNPDIKAAQQAVGAMVRTFADQVPMLQGIRDVNDFTENAWTASADLAAQTARTFIPSLFGMFERMVDEYRRKPDGIAQTLQSMIPILAANGIDVGPLHVTPVAGVSDALGRAVENTNTGAMALFPRGGREREEHPVLTENERLKAFGFPGFTGVTKTTPILGTGANAITLSPDGAARYQEIAGQLTDRLVTELLNSPAYAQKSDEQKAKDFQTKVDYAKLEARRRLAEEYLGVVTDDAGLKTVVARVAPDKALGVAIGMRSYTKLHERADFLATLLPQIEGDPALRDAVEAEMTNKPRGPLQSGTVTKVTDGDTIVIGEKTYRLYGVDVPEPNTPEGRAAMQALFAHLSGKTITFQTDKQDSFGRGLAEVYADGKSVTDWIIDQGLGKPRLPPQTDPNRYSLETYRRIIPLRQQVKSDPILSAEYVRNGQVQGDPKVWAQVDAERRAAEAYKKSGATQYEADIKYPIYAAYRKLGSQPGGKNPVRKKFVEDAVKRGIPLDKFLGDIVAEEDHE